MVVPFKKLGTASMLPEALEEEAKSDSPKGVGQECPPRGHCHEEIHDTKNHHQGVGREEHWKTSVTAGAGWVGL